MYIITYISSIQNLVRMTIRCKIHNTIQNVQIKLKMLNVPYVLTFTEHYTTDSLYINM